MNLLTILHPPPLQEASQDGTLAELALLSVVGIAIVFAALWVTGELLGLLTRLFPEEPGTPPEPEMSPAPAEAEGPDARTLAVITAAAFAAVGRPLRVRQVTPAARPGSAWSDAGRATLVSSHNVKRNR